MGTYAKKGLLSVSKTGVLRKECKTRMKVYLIRHGMTKGNREHRYVGTTDESLLAESAKRLRGKCMEAVRHVYVSPRKRCIETAECLYPNQEKIVIDALAECDFGVFEYHNYEELNGREDYQRFIDTMGESGFPGGEEKAAFQERCVKGFREILQREQKEGWLLAEKGDKGIALVVHGGTIMSILDAFSVPHRDYYDWQIKNEEGYVTEVLWNMETDQISMKVLERI